MSECLIIAVNRSRDENKFGSVGLPSSSFSFEIRNSTQQAVKKGEVGEVCVKGKNVMLGYWHNEEATQKALREGWLYTGDLAYQDKDNYLWIVGRLKNIIIRDGDNVSPYEIEEVLASHPSVKISAVLGVFDQSEGQVPYAFVELKNPCTIQDLQKYLENKLDKLSMPKYFKIVSVLPRTPNGKIDRERLRDLVEDQLR